MPGGGKPSYYECQQCGYQAARWLGRCPDCGAWGSLSVTQASPPAGAKPHRRTGSRRESVPVALGSIPAAASRRQSTGIGELDRVLGGGLVPGAVILVGGDPGVGKSTLLLQAAASLATQGLSILYVSGEESPAQIGERGRRLGLTSSTLLLLAETSLEAILEQVATLKPAMVVLDSVQTVWSQALESSAGSLSQVREVAGRLAEVAKRDEIGVWLIGHVTKEGSLAGPKALEHLVDTVIYFEGERSQGHRIVRAVKNRFGPTDEIGVFEMRGEGLTPVENPSAAFLAGRPPLASGSTVVATLEGSRPILLEIQALATPTGAPVPRRVANGLDFSRMAMLLAVLEKRLGLSLGTMDVFLNVVGGLLVREPAADLGVMAAVLSSVRDVPVQPTWAFFGEVGLGGEVRAVPQAEKRLQELERLGFTRAILPHACQATLSNASRMDLVGIEHVEALADVMGMRRSGRQKV
jgi:DNA repair protein RadA/Sms